MRGALIEYWLDSERLVLPAPCRYRDIQTQLASAVASASGLLVIESAASRASRWVQFEIGIARQYGRPLFRLTPDSLGALELPAMRGGLAAHHTGVDSAPMDIETCPCALSVRCDAAAKHAYPKPGAGGVVACWPREARPRHTQPARVLLPDGCDIARHCAHQSDGLMHVRQHQPRHRRSSASFVKARGAAAASRGDHQQPQTEVILRASGSSAMSSARLRRL
jgi:hypothetical protein